MGNNKYGNVITHEGIQNVIRNLRDELNEVNDEIAELAIGGDSFQHLVDKRVMLISDLHDAQEKESKFVFVQR